MPQTGVADPKRAVFNVKGAGTYEDLTTDEQEAGVRQKVRKQAWPELKLTGGETTNPFAHDQAALDTKRQKRAEQLAAEEQVRLKIRNAHKDEKAMNMLKPHERALMWLANRGFEKKVQNIQEQTNFVGELVQGQQEGKYSKETVDAQGEQLEQYKKKLKPNVIHRHLKKVTDRREAKVQEWNEASKKSYVEHQPEYGKNMDAATREKLEKEWEASVAHIPKKARWNGNSNKY